MTPLVKGFLNDWKKSLELINQEIMRSFTNFKNGQTILQVTLFKTEYFLTLFMTRNKSAERFF